MTETIDLQPFCDTSSRHAIDRPFVVDGWRYATNGKIWIALPAEGEPNSTRDDGKRVPDVKAIIRNWGADHWNHWPEVALYARKRVNCQECNGTGTDVVDCPKCDGEGYEVCPMCHNEDECTRCKGEGTIPRGTCPDCLGAKQSEVDHHMELGSLWIAADIDKLVRLLPPAEYAIGEHQTIYLRFDGGRGVLMPIAKG